MLRSSVVVSCVLLAAGGLWPVAVQGQPLGTFRWQMQPFCNVLTLTVTQNGSVYTLDGFDDQCGATPRAPVTGTAVPNPDGTVEIGLNIVVAPDAGPLHVAVPLNLVTLGGPWKDSAGLSGTFTFAPNGGTGGSTRPASAGLGAVAVDPEQVQLRVSGQCPTGQMVQRINQDGTVTCAAGAAGGITAVNTPFNGGLLGIVDDGEVTLSLKKLASGEFDLYNQAGVVAGGAPLSGKILIWDAAKAAFRAGREENGQWSPGNVGEYSVAMGRNTEASGTASFAMGENVIAEGAGSTAIGSVLQVLGDFSVALGRNAGTSPTGTGSFVWGDNRSNAAFLQAYFPNQFLVRAVGGTEFYSNDNHTSGVRLATGGGAWSSVSDARMKENFRDLDGRGVLQKLAQMPIREWNYTSQDAAIRHVGPTAQDFHAAFGLGEDPLRISTIDADGIALRAIQALEARTRAYEARIQQLELELAAIRDGGGARR